MFWESRHFLTVCFLLPVKPRQKSLLTSSNSGSGPSEAGPSGKLLHDQGLSSYIMQPSSLTKGQFFVSSGTIFISITGCPTSSGKSGKVYVLRNSYEGTLSLLLILRIS